MRHDQAHAAVLPLGGRVMVEIDPVVSVVKGFHPMVVELEVPVLTTRRLHVDDQRLFRAQLPVAVVVVDMRVSVGRAGNRRVEGG